MELRATTFRDGESIPEEHLAGSARPIVLEWSGEPAETRSFVVAVEELDTHGNGDVRWIRYDVPAEVHQISTADTHVGVAGGERDEWRGLAPAAPTLDRRYRFRLLAVTSPSLGLGPGARLDEILARTRGKVLDTAELMARHEIRTDPSGATQGGLRGMFWGTLIVYVLGALGLVLLGLAGIYIAAILAAVGIVVLMIWIWRRMSRRPAPTQRASRGPDTAAR